MWTFSDNKDWFIKLSTQRQTTAVPQSNKSWEAPIVLLLLMTEFGASPFSWSHCWQRYTFKKSRWYIRPFCERSTFCFLLFSQEWTQKLEQGFLCNWFASTSFKILQWWEKFQELSSCLEEVSFAITLSILMGLQGSEVVSILQGWNV